MNQLSTLSYDVAVEEKVCRKCGFPQPIDNFARQADTRDGRQSWCRGCKAGLMQRSRAGKHQEGGMGRLGNISGTEREIRALYNEEIEKAAHALPSIETGMLVLWTWDCMDEDVELSLLHIIGTKRDGRGQLMTFCEAVARPIPGAIRHLYGNDAMQKACFSCPQCQERMRKYLFQKERAA